MLQGPAAAAAAAAARRLQPHPALLNQEICFSKNPQVLYAHVKVLEALFLRLLDSGDESTNILLGPILWQMFFWQMLPRDYEHESLLSRDPDSKMWLRYEPPSIIQKQSKLGEM